MTTTTDKESQRKTLISVLFGPLHVARQMRGKFKWEEEGYQEDDVLTTKKSRFECSPQGAHILIEKSVTDLFGTGDGYRRYFVGTLALALRSSASATSTS